MLWVLFGTLFICLIFTVPIGLSLGIASAAVIFYSFPETEMINLLAQSIVTAIDSFPLMAIPFFMLLGILMEQSGLAKRLIDMGAALAGPMPGGLALAAIIAAMLFSTVSGSGPAVVAAIGAIMIPSMRDKGYPPEYSAGLIASASVAGPVLPPSIILILYGATVGVSITQLFTAGIIPGVMIFIALMGANHVISVKRGFKGIPREGGVLWVLVKCRDAFWALLMPIIVLGGIYGGFFTPTESAVVGVFYAIIVGVFVYRQLTLKGFIEALWQTAKLSSMIMIIMGGATTFGRVLTLERVPEMLVDTILGITESPILIMLMMNVFLLIFGLFLDTISSTILFSPLLLPLAITAGYDPVAFGIIMCINISIGFITPPLAVGLFVAQGIAGVPFEAIQKTVLPFLAVLVVVLAIFIAFPEIIMFLPNLVH